MISASLQSTAIVLGIWLLIAWVLVVFGLSVQRLFGLTRLTSRRVLTAFWVGYLCVTAVLQVWNFWLPVGNVAATLTLVAAVGLSFWHARAVALWLRRLVRTHKVALCCFALVAAWAANRATGPCEHFDTGMYHTTAIRWVSDYPIIPGLGNLHLQLATNNLSWIFAALLEAGPGRSHSHHFANTVLILALLAQVFASAVHLLREGWSSQPERAFDIALALPLIDLMLSKHYVGQSTDVSVTAVLFFAVSLAFVYLSGRIRGRREQFYVFIVLCMLFTLSACIKMSVAGYAVAAFLVVVVFQATRHNVTRKVRGWQLAAAVILCSAVAVPHMIRDAFLSGYLLYPATLLALPMDWTMPREEVVAESRLVRLFGQYYYYQLGGAFELRPIPEVSQPGWIIPWLAHLYYSRMVEVVFPILMAVIAGVAYVIGRVRLGAASPRLTAAKWLLLPLATGTGIWLWLAPQPRLGMFLMPLFGATCLALAMRFFAGVGSPRPGNWALAILLSMAVLPIASDARSNFNRMHGAWVRAITEVLVVPPGPNHGLHPLPRTPSVSFTTDSGLLLHVYRVKCWDGTLPCTTNPSRYLRLRKPGDLRSGFTVDGKWDPPPPRTLKGVDHERERP